MLLFLKHSLSPSRYLWMWFPHLSVGYLMCHADLGPELSNWTWPSEVKSASKGSWDYLQRPPLSIFAFLSTWGGCVALGAWCMFFIPWGDAIPPRKASLGIHWCALDWEIIGANCLARKCGRQCSAMLFKRDMHARTNSDRRNHKTHQHACMRTNYFRSRHWGEAVDLKRRNKKDYSFWRYAAALGDKASIHLGLNLRHSAEK